MSIQMTGYNTTIIEPMEENALSKRGSHRPGGPGTGAKQPIKRKKADRAQHPATGRKIPRRAPLVQQQSAQDESAKDVATAIAEIVAFYSLQDGFDEQTQAQAALVATWDIAEEIPQRLDLRGVRCFTIDGADAKDFDDAVSIESLPDGGVCLGVHIADVSWYVRPGTTLDVQAQLRGTSVYLPGKVLPMLPESISNGCCSLKPDEDRLTLSVLVAFDEEGKTLGYEIHRSIIRSSARLVYEDVNLLLQGEVEQVQRYAQLLPDIQAMAALSAKLRTARYARGGLDLDVDEALIVLDAQGEPVDIAPRPRKVSERMIEDFMLLANEMVARHAQARALPCLYRVHEPMDPDKAKALTDFLRGLGLRVRAAAAGGNPKALQQVLRDASAKPEYPIVAQLVLRAMQKARYDVQALGHYGLASKDYCHFTAPIRRYPDLFVHRMLSADMTGELRFSKQAMQATAPALAAHTSACERRAMEAERAVEKMMMARYMSNHIGEVYEGMIISVVEWGLYVALPSTVEGLVHIRTLPGYFVLNREQHCLIRQGDGELYRLGQTVQVRVQSVDTGAGQIDFVLDPGKEAGVRGRTV